MARFSDGLAVGPDLTRAAQSAVEQALAALDRRQPDLLCVFASGADPEAVEAAGRRAMECSGARTTLGCSAEGVIGGGRGIELTSAVSVWAAQLPGVRLTPFRLESVRGSDRHVVSGMPDRRDDDAVALLLADPATFPATAFVERSNHVLSGLPLVGGLVSSELGAAGHRMFVQGRTVRSGAVGAVLGGDVSVRTVVSQGCRPVGPPMAVTKAHGNVINELAGSPALSKLEEVVAALPPEDRRLIRPALLVGIAMDEYSDRHEYGDFLVRSVVGADGEEGSIAVAEPVEVGRTLRLHVRDSGTAASDMDRLLSRFRAEPPFGAAEGALLFSCNGRGTVLFPDADHDVRAVRRGLGTAGVGGFFAAGEIGPVAGRNHVHGFTASILAFGSGAAAERGAASAGGSDRS